MREYTKYLSFIPYILGFLSVSAIIHESVYYSYFGVNLLYFIDAGEALTLFVNNLNSWLFVFVIMMSIKSTFFSDTYINAGDFRYRLLALAIAILAFTIYNVVQYYQYAVTTLFVYILLFYSLLSWFFFRELKTHSFYEIRTNAPFRTIMLPLFLWLLVIFNTTVIDIAFYDESGWYMFSRKQRGLAIVLVNGDTLRNGIDAIILGKTRQHVFLRYSTYTRVINSDAVNEYYYEDPRKRQ